MTFLHENPLELLFFGPLDDTSLAIAGVELMPDISYWELLDVILHIKHKILAGQDVIITPHWWQGPPEDFREQMNERLSSMLADEDLTDETRQIRVLETLLNMWAEFLGI